MASNQPAPVSGEASTSPGMKKEVERDAQMVGKKFIIKYYQTLSKEPSNLHKFYKGASQLTRGSGSSPVDPVRGPDEIRDALSAAGLADAQVDLEDGSLDAQDSHGGGVLIVVTGRITLSAAGSARPFVHTFFLTREVSGGGKKHFYVLNDIFRFMGDELTEPPNLEEVPAAVVAPEPVSVPEPVLIEQEPETELDLEVEIIAAPPPAPASSMPPTRTPPRRSRAPVQKPAPKPALAAPQAPAPESGAEEGKGADDHDSSAGRIEDSVPSLPAPPGTWASKLFSSGGGGNGNFSSPRGGGRRSAPQAPATGGFDGKSPGGDAGGATSRLEKPIFGRGGASGGPKRRGTSKGKEAHGGDEENKTDRTDSRASSKGRPKRVDPERERNVEGGRNNKNGAASLYIKNLQEGITEEAVKLLFGRFGKVVGITVNAGRGFAFVDYADVASVATALTDKSLLVINGLKLDAQAKNASRAMRDAGRGSYTGGGPRPGVGGRRPPAENGVEDAEGSAGARKGEER